MIKAKFKESEFLWEEFFKFLESFEEKYEVEEVKEELEKEVVADESIREGVVSKLKSLSAKDYSTVKGLSQVVSELIKLL